MILLNFRNYSPSKTMSHHRRLISSYCISINFQFSPFSSYRPKHLKKGWYKTFLPGTSFFTVLIQWTELHIMCAVMQICKWMDTFNPLKPKLNPICYLLALLGAHHFLHVSRIRVKSLTLRRLMSYIYGAPILDVSRSHTTTQHSR